MRPNLRRLAASLHGLDWQPWWIGASIWLGLVAVAVAALWHLRLDALDVQRRELSLVSSALTDETERGMRGVEEGLHAMRAELAEDRLPLAGADGVRALRTRADLMPLVDRIWLLDAAGATLAASDVASAPEPQAFAPPLNDLADGAMALSRPFGVAMPSGTDRVAVAMRFGVADRDLAGWIVAAMPASVLLGAFAAAQPSADERMFVFRGDGTLIAGANGPSTRTGADDLAQRLFRRPSPEVSRFADGSDNLVAWHDVARYGVRVVVTRNLDSVLAAWRGAVDLTMLALAALLAVIAAAVQHVQRADRRRGEAQEALQAQMLRASRLESLGILAGGVAHDFNNVLAGIVGYGELARETATVGSDQARHLDRVLRAALRGKTLIDRILTFSRGGARRSTVFEMEPVVEEVLALLAASLQPGIVLERCMEAPDARVRGDPTQAFEAVMNVCTNAMDAMPSGGMLSIRLHRVGVDADRVLSHSRLAAGAYLALDVADQGAGIAPEVMNHLFEPFFTTRGGGGGTGLGLAVVHGVVAEFGGAIDVRSEAGQGARFTMYFPETREPVGRQAAAPVELRVGHGERILVVDDEPDLVGLAMEMLGGMGYVAQGYVDSRAALEALQADAGSFAAVVTDEAMPDLTGIQLTRAVHRAAPGLPVLLVSGYGGALIARRAAEAGVSRVLAKPLQRVELAEAMAAVLPH